MTVAAVPPGKWPMVGCFQRGARHQSEGGRAETLPHLAVLNGGVLGTGEVSRREEAGTPQNVGRDAGKSLTVRLPGAWQRQ